MEVPSISDHAVGKVQLGKRPVLSALLTTEKNYLVQWTHRHVCGQTQGQVTEMVRKILDKDG